MKIYIVGGAIRDVLLGLEPKDIDFCVTGATPDMMLSLGFKKIEATSFPVFHDDLRQEYALARTEKKSGTGYHGFEIDYNPKTTIAEDLSRRDITINSMAVLEEDWEYFKETKDTTLLIDPYDGKKDIRNKKIQHTSKHFGDDPVRALRAVRLANRYNFKISKSTRELISDMGESGELDHLTPERIWLEIEKVFDQNTNIGSFFLECDNLKIPEHIFPVINGEELFIDYNDLSTYHQSDIKCNQFAFLSMVNTNSLSYIEGFCKHFRIASKHLKLFKAYITIQQYLFDEPADPAELIRCLNDVNVYKNSDMLIKVIKFFKLIEKKFEKELQNLEKGYIMTKNINHSFLSKIQQNSLKGKQIGIAIDNLRIETLENAK
jgi:tRNA nucleotidyltransferase (CCA-adding enzyme)